MDLILLVVAALMAGVTLGCVLTTLLLRAFQWPPVIGSVAGAFGALIWAWAGWRYLRADELLAAWAGFYAAMAQLSVSLLVLVVFRLERPATPPRRTVRRPDDAPTHPVCGR